MNATATAQATPSALTPADIFEPGHPYSLETIERWIGVQDKELRPALNLHRVRDERSRAYWLRNAGADDLHPMVDGGELAAWITRNNIAWSVTWAGEREYRDRQQKIAQQELKAREQRLLRFTELLNKAAAVHGRPAGYWPLLASGSSSLDDAERLQALMIAGSLTTGMVEADIEAVHLARRLVEIMPLLTQEERG